MGTREREALLLHAQMVHVTHEVAWPNIVSINSCLTWGIIIFSFFAAAVDWHWSIFVAILLFLLICSLLFNTMTANPVLWDAAHDGTNSNPTALRTQTDYKVLLNPDLAMPFPPITCLPADI